MSRKRAPQGFGRATRGWAICTAGGMVNSAIVANKRDLLVALMRRPGSERIRRVEVRALPDKGHPDHVDSVRRKPDRRQLSMFTKERQ